MRQIKLLLVLGLVLFIVFLVILFRLLFGSRGVSPTVTSEPTILPNADIFPKEATLFPTPTDVKPSFTGDKEEALPLEEHLEIEQMRQLRKQSPYQGDGFTIVFDYGDGRFVVTGVSEGEFFQWLVTSEFKQIGSKWFKFQ